MKIADLILNHINRDYLLPSIQREFVWGRKNNRVENLFDSIMQGYPIGSILVWVVNKEPELSKINWEVYNFVQDYNEDRPHNILANLNGYSILNLILDGQQRLTALNIGLKGSYSFSMYNRSRKTKLYLNLFSDIENNIDNTYGLKYEFKFFESAPENNQELWYEVGKVLDYSDKKTEDFKEDFDDTIRNKTNDKELIKKAKETLGDLHSKICKEDLITSIPVTTTDDEKVLNIFVRTNDGGLKLEKADLLLSFMESDKTLFMPNGARKEVFDFTDKLNKIELEKPNYNFKKDDILKACLVLSKLEVQYKLKNFNNENLKIISNNWSFIKTNLDLTVKLIAKYGFSSKNIISKNALIPITYFIQEQSKTKEFIYSNTNQDIELKNEIINWLIISQLTGAFGSSSDSTLKSVCSSIDKKVSFKDINLGKIINKEMITNWIDNEKYNSKLSHLILMLITENKYWDNCHQDHIFPISKFNSTNYKKLQLSDSQIDFYNNNANSIANLNLLNPTINIVKGADDFIDWQSNQNSDFLNGSLIPTNIDYKFENFEEFVKLRKDKIITKLSNILINRNVANI